MRPDLRSFQQRIQTFDEALSRKPVKYLPGFRSGHWWKRLLATAVYAYSIWGIVLGLAVNNRMALYFNAAALGLCLSVPYAITVYLRHRANLPPQAMAFTPTNLLFPSCSLIFSPDNIQFSWAEFFSRAARKGEIVLTVPQNNGRPVQLGTESKVAWNGSRYVVEGFRRVRVLKLQRTGPDVYKASYLPLDDRVGPNIHAYVERVAGTFMKWAQLRPELGWSYRVQGHPPAVAVNTMCHAIFLSRPEEWQLLGIDDLGQRAARIEQELARFGYPMPPTSVDKPVVPVPDVSRHPPVPSIPPGGRFPEPPKQPFQARTSKAEALGASTTEVGSKAAHQTIPIDELLARLDALVGLEAVKAQVRKIIAKVDVNKRRIEAGHKPLEMSHHLIFAGAPGTGKTTVARLYGELLAAAGVLKNGQLVEATRSDLVSQFVGDTAIKTKKLFDQARGGVLFVDEVYSLKHDEKGGGQDTVGQEAIDTLVKLMEDHRDEVVVIVAGYGNRMARFLDSNPGLKSRFSSQIDFPNYSVSELVAIFEGSVQESGFEMDDGTVELARKVLEQMPKGANFGNAREVRTLWEAIEDRQAERLSVDPTANLTTIIPADVTEARRDRVADESEVEALLARLDGMIGLTEVKEQVRSLVDGIKLNKDRRDSGLPVTQLAEHLIFAGSPGTGKTTVARLYGELLASMGILSNGQLIEADRSSLVGGWQGHTALQVKEIFETANGGVLFVDEVYSLKHDSNDAFGQEAIDAMVKLMEDYRDHVVVIVAGYSSRMQGFLDTNPGLSSRLGQTIEFEDYSPAELTKIFELLAEEKSYKVAPSARRAVQGYFENVPRDDNFGNGREARNLLQQAFKNVARRHQSDPRADMSLLVSADIEAAGKQRQPSGAK